jgi:hypothetical protein
MPGGKSKKSHKSPSQLANAKSLEQLKRMAKREGVPQSKDGHAFNKAQLARRIAAKH